jgi:hypothetical protein
VRTKRERASERESERARARERERFYSKPLKIELFAPDAIMKLT